MVESDQYAIILENRTKHFLNLLGNDGLKKIQSSHDPLSFGFKLGRRAYVVFVRPASSSGEWVANMAIHKKSLIGLPASKPVYDKLIAVGSLGAPVIDREFVAKAALGSFEGDLLTAMINSGEPMSFTLDGNPPTQVEVEFSMRNGVSSVDVSFD